MHSAPARRILAAGLLTAIAGYGALSLCVKPLVFHHSNSDFATFYRAGKMVLSGEGNLAYNLSAERRYDDALGTTSLDAEGNSVSLPFVFAPFSLAVYTPLALLPYDQAEGVCYAVNVTMLLALPFLLRKRLALEPKILALALLAPMLFLPVVLALLQGQPSILLLMLFAMAFADLADGKEGRAGCWLALASFKPQLVLPLLLALLIWRKLGTLQSFALTCCGLTLVSMALTRVRATLHYPLALMQYATMGSRLGAEHPASMPNLRGFLYLALHSHMSASVLQQMTLALSLLILAATALLLGRRRQITAVTFSLVLAVTLLTSYHAYLHDDSLLLLPILLMAGTPQRTRAGIDHRVTIAAVAALFAAPWMLTSLTTTAWLMFLVIASFAALLGSQTFRGIRNPLAAEEQPQHSAMLAV